MILPVQGATTATSDAILVNLFWLSRCYDDVDHRYLTGETKLSSLNTNYNIIIPFYFSELFRKNGILSLDVFWKCWSNPR